MLSTAAYMLDISLTGESPLDRISSSNDTSRRMQPPPLLYEPRHVQSTRHASRTRHAFSIHFAKPLLMCGVAVG